MKARLFWLVVMVLFGVSCSQISDRDQEYFDLALENGLLVNEGYNRCVNYMYDWLTHTDSLSGLFPENLAKGRDVWNAHNSAADNYPFMVLTSYLLDKDLYNGRMLDILNSERLRTSRLGTLPDAFSFSKQDFVKTEIDTPQIIFGTSEYIKDGLIPLTEYLGVSPWNDRMIEMLNDLNSRLEIDPDLEGYYSSQSIETEINGEMLQTLSRVYWMTGNSMYLNWAIEIADYYLLENTGKILESEQFRLRDHGCEIVGGLSELYAAVHYTDKEKKAAYRKSIYKIFDRILEVGRNEDGMFYNEINMITGEVVNDGIVDNWGYLYNAYYTLYLIDNKTAYRDAVLHSFKALRINYVNYNWESKGSDGFADAIESGINLYNRERSPELKGWLDSEIKIMWSLQDSAYRESAQVWKNRGIIEGWHGDGNFARTTIMYCLWKTHDITLHPWNENLSYGTTMNDGVLYITIKAEEDWEGNIMFGIERHKEILNLPLDYPRINQFPEWFSISTTESYTIASNGKKSEIEGDILKEGIQLKLKKDKPYYIKIDKSR